MILDCNGDPVEVEPIPDRPPVDKHEAAMLRLCEIADAFPDGPEAYWRGVAQFSGDEDE